MEAFVSSTASAWPGGKKEIRMSASKGGVPVLKARLVRGKEVVLDWADILLGRRDWSTPPRRLMFVGGGDFSKIGERYLNFFVDVCGLKPDDSVLDAGCGVGRLAIPLTRYLSPPGAYRGFDVVKPGIEWCSQAITPRFPHFQFEWANLYNKTYNPQGTMTAADFRFPYEDQQFDFIFLTSVFTHMLPGDVDHYLAEIARVLRPGKFCLTTYFLLNEESRRLMASGASRLDFKYGGRGYLTLDPTLPESAVAHEEAFILASLSKAGLAVDTSIRYGSWCGRKGTIRFQDEVVAKKAAG